MPRLAKYAELRATLFTPVSALLNDTPGCGHAGGGGGRAGMDAAGTAPLSTCSHARSSSRRAATPSTRAAAVAGLQLIPESAWSKGALEPLARAVVAMVKATAPERRTDPDDDRGAAARGEAGRARCPTNRDVLSGGTCAPSACVSFRSKRFPSRLLFDLKWFVVEAGKPVQIVLSNPDGMPHNLVVGQPGSVRDIGTAGAAVPPTSDPNAKAYVPDTATRPRRDAPAERR